MKPLPKKWLVAAAVVSLLLTAYVGSYLAIRSTRSTTVLPAERLILPSGSMQLTRPWRIVFLSQLVDSDEIYYVLELLYHPLMKLDGAITGESVTPM